MFTLAACRIAAAVIVLAAADTVDAADAADVTAPAIAIPEIAQQAESGLASVRQIERRDRIAETLDAAKEQIPSLERETTYRLQELRRLSSSAFSLDNLQSLDAALRDIEQRTVPVRRDLTRAALRIDQDLEELQQLEATWTATIKAAVQAGAPADVLDRAKDLVPAIALARKNLRADRAQLLALQGRATDIGTRLTDIRQLLADASEHAVTKLFYQDDLPLWSAAFWTESIHSISGESMEHIDNQTFALAEYFRVQRRSFLLHGILIGAFVIVLLAARTKVAELAKSDDGLRAGEKIFDMPVVTAILLAMLFSAWFYDRPPRLLWLIIGILSTVPLLLLSRRIIAPEIYPQICYVVIFYLADKGRTLVSPLPGVYRFLLLLEAMALAVVILVTLRRRRNMLARPSSQQQLAYRMIGFGSRIALLLCIFVLAAGVAGYASLADLLMRTLLSSAYTAAILYALTRAAEGLVHGLLYVPPLSFLAGVQRHRAPIATRINKWLKWIALISWAVVTLQAPGLLQRVIAWIKSVWQASGQIGSLEIAVSDIAIFFLILWSTYVISRLLRFLLEEEIFSRMHLDRGLPYAVSTTLHYIVLLSGFVFALSAIGVDMTRFTIVAGALTVGIGFGLQNIVNNFVSGLIVLFERPVKIGDTIQIDDIVGRVQHIGIRATIIQSTAGAEVIIPNGKLISDKVTNWTLSNQLHQVAVPVITRADTNVVQLKAILMEAAGQNRQVLQTPAPEVLFIKRGVDTFEFELRVWTSDLDAWLRVKSDLITAINEALKHQEIAASVPAPASS